MNTSGGLLSKGHPVAATGATGIEAKTLAEMIADLNQTYGDKFASATEVPDVATMESLAKEFDRLNLRLCPSFATLLVRRSFATISNKPSKS